MPGEASGGSEDEMLCRVLQIGPEQVEFSDCDAEGTYRRICANPSDSNGALYCADPPTVQP